MSDRDPEPGFVPISPNPYIVGTPVRDPAMFFGREAEFELVRRRFQSPTEGGLLVFCGERRSGKTSILFQIVQGRLGPGFIPVLIDMQSMAIESEIEFLGKVSEEIALALARDGDRVSPPDFAEGSNPTALFQRFLESILHRHRGKRLILLFDEYELFENKIDSGRLTQDLLNILANLMEHHHVLLIFTGSQHLEQRRREYWKILGKSLYRHISYLQREDAYGLIRKPVEGRVEYAEGVVEAIYRLSAGHPFYTQAICQNIVDYLNERRASRVTKEMLTQVVHGIVESPFPQMLFLWDALERDEKFVLSLLAETLADENDTAAVRGVLATMEKTEYPLDLSEARIASTCDRLFGTDLLQKSGEPAPSYAFRPDLLRVWIRRMHSVWQVMRDEGLEIPAGAPDRGARRRRLTAAVLGIAAIAVLAAISARWLARPPGNREGIAAQAPAAPPAVLRLESQPGETRIYRDGNLVGMGSLTLRLEGGREHAIRLGAPGYRDSGFVFQARAGDSVRREVALRPLLGGVRLETIPDGAMVTVDGQPRGRSPTTVRALAVPVLHLAAANLPGFLPVEIPFHVKPDTMLIVSLVLSTRSKDVYVTTAPPGATVLLDGVVRGQSPLSLRGVPHGPHTVEARMPGYKSMAFPTRVGEGTGQLHLILTPEPKETPP